MDRTNLPDLVLSNITVVFLGELIDFPSLLGFITRQIHFISTFIFIVLVLV